MKNSLRIISALVGCLFLGTVVYATVTTARTTGVNKLPWNGSGSGATYFDAAHHRGGAASDVARFTGTLGAGNIITDMRTGLQWESVPALTTQTGWAAAKTHCASLTRGGYSDWRLPNIQELMSIVDYGKTNGTHRYYTSKFTLGSTYWSSTTYAAKTDNAYILRFSSGHVDTNGKTSYTNSVICTR